ncbi:MAG: SPOR domain-containing protein [Flavobacteriales bacterium]|nr:SPOR domain-containing protein [Flavobacteriales bacterium]
MGEQTKGVSFTLDGSIEDRGNTTSDNRSFKQKLRLWQIGGSVGLLLLAALFTWQLLKGIKQEQMLDKAKVELQNVAQRDHQIDSLSRHLDSLSKKIALVERDNELLIENSERLDGIFYEVQIGSFSDFDLDNYLEQLANIRQEKYDGKTKLLLGRFRSFKKALLFENDLKKLGLDEVFIVGRIDGVLVPYKEALEAQQRGE